MERKRMSDRDSVELCAVWKRDDGTEMVQTGIYVFDDTMLKDVRRLMMLYSESGEEPPYKVEFRVKGDEE